MAAPVSSAGRSAGPNGPDGWRWSFGPESGQLLPCEAGRVPTMDLTGSGGSGVSNLTTVEVSLTMTRFVRELIKYSPLMWLSGLFSGIAIETEESSWMHWLGIPLGLLFLVLWGIAILATSKLLEREMTTANNEQDNA